MICCRGVLLADDEVRVGVGSLIRGDGEVKVGSSKGDF